MSIFSKLFKSKNPSSPRYRLDMAQRICKHHIRYVTENRNGNDDVIGKDGGLNIKDDCLLVFASGTVLFRCRITELEAWDLLSGDGVVLTGPDLENGGAVRTLVVYYVYYR
ncbi:MAG: hypothetical protein IJR83_05665 [Clostridia bacterium]|nr:hypothetical protein [Clostridia bacterium]